MVLLSSEDCPSSFLYAFFFLHPVKVKAATKLNAAIE
jgi:hypothetical protein